MNELEVLRGVVVNVFLMLGFVSVCSLVNNWMVRHRHKVSIGMTGFLFGSMAMVAMFSPIVTRSDFMLDCRAGVIGAAALLGGVPVMLLCLIQPMAYRICLGGRGLVLGVACMVFAAALGTLCHFALRHCRKTLSVRQILTASLVVGLGTTFLLAVFFLQETVQMVQDLGVGGFLTLFLMTPVSMALLSSFLVREHYHNELHAAVVDSERRMLHSQKMVAVGQLAHRIAHSVLNVLAVILGNAEQAKAQAVKTVNTDYVTPIMDNIITAVNDLSALTGELMAFSAQGESRFRRMELSRCLMGIRQLLAKVIGSSVKVTIQDCCDTGLVHVDPNLVEQLVMHLAINASEAMNGRGRLTVAMHRCELSKTDRTRLFADVPDAEQHRGAFAVLSVQDTGCGMTEQVVSRMFEPFFTTKGRRENAGLGLPSVYNIVQKHRGGIDVKTRPGQGTTFLIYFPVVG